MTLPALTRRESVARITLVMGGAMIGGDALLRARRCVTWKYPAATTATRRTQKVTAPGFPAHPDAFDAADRPNTAMNACQTISVSIDRPTTTVYHYLADPARFPEWSEFITAIRADGASWIATTPNGEVRMTFAARNPFMVLDHDVMAAPGVQVHVPLRVVPNGNGSEVLFTIFRQPEMTDQAFAADVETVRRDLANLKRQLEQSG